jgi:hypothetical protein
MPTFQTPSYASYAGKTSTSLPPREFFTHRKSRRAKYHGHCDQNSQVCAELQIVAMLIGLFWEVEHGALYKPAAGLRDIELREEIQQRNLDVIRALGAFDEQFDNLIEARASIRR